MINSCDLFAFHKKEEQKYYVLLSFFTKRTKKTLRHIQHKKTLLVFSENDTNIRSSILHKLKENNAKNLFYFGGSFIIDFMTKLDGIKVTTFSKDIEQKGLYYLLDKLNFPEKEDYKPTKHSLNIKILIKELNKKEYIYSVLGYHSLADMYHNKNAVLNHTNFTLSSQGSFSKLFKSAITEYVNNSDFEYSDIYLNLHKMDGKYKTFLNDAFCNALKKELSIKSITHKSVETLNNEISNKVITDLKEKITKIKENATKTEDNDVLYTDGSSIKIEDQNFISGAFLFHTENGYRHGSEVLSFHNLQAISSNEAEFLALYLGLKDYLKFKTNKKLSLVTDSDSVHNFLTTLLNNKEQQTKTIFDNITKYRIKQLLSEIGYNYQSIVIKSHKKNDNDLITKHNKAVDRLAYNSIIDHLEEKNIEHEFKKRIA